MLLQYSHILPLVPSISLALSSWCVLFHRRKILTIITNVTFSGSRDGLMKMKGVYEQNPALGDPMSIEGQLNESGHKLDKLRLELQKYQGFLEDGNITNDGNSPANLRRQNSTVNNVNGLQNNYQ